MQLEVLSPTQALALKESLQILRDLSKQFQSQPLVDGKLRSIRLRLLWVLLHSDCPDEDLYRFSLEMSLLREFAQSPVL